MQRVRLQTPDGIREYPLTTGTAEYELAKASGEIHIGDEIIYKNCLVEVIEDFEMLVLEPLQGVPIFNAGAQDMGGFAGFAGAMPNGMGNAHWSFTVNGQPVSPDQMEQFMKGGQMGH